ncbi:serine threonine- kinase Nek5-like isoform X1 [Labeo rohita]|uniref:non-specific serine/threonine protein kinase n=1 Tax=Labeo rohita TaxID=84645 RepID=A0A498L8Y1_LABRO|nr:serine threonine- kinase Nek5-like isoform X1 [Labeo rohita]
MGNSLSALKEHGYSLVSQQENKILVKNEGGDQFVIKKLSANQEESQFLLHLNHPHIVQHKEFIEDSDCLYLVLEHCEGGNLAQKIKNKKEGNAMFSENEILDCIVKICMALKYLHDQQILHKNLQPERLKSYTRNTMGQGRLSSLALLAIERTLVKSLEKTPSWSTEQQTEENKPSYVAPEILNGIPYEEKRQ